LYGPHCPWTADVTHEKPEEPGGDEDAGADGDDPDPEPDPGFGGDSGPDFVGVADARVGVGDAVGCAFFAAADAEGGRVARMGVLVTPLSPRPTGAWLLLLLLSVAQPLSPSATITIEAMSGLFVKANTP
jgi:hypothetical protein